MEEKRFIIAIDGYSSCGKSTLAKLLAAKLKILFIDTGAMYRAVTLFALQNDLFHSDGAPKTKKLIERLSEISIHFDTTQSIEFPTILLNGKNVQQEIRTMEVNANVSIIAAISEVRRKLVEEQRKLGSTRSVVMDGRDIGTVVFPHADLKLFLTASNEVRAQRRFDEMRKANPDFDGTLEAVMENLLERDHIDMTRADSPLQKADDALEIDNTDLTIEAQLNYVLELIKNRIQ